MEIKKDFHQQIPGFFHSHRLYRELIEKAEDGAHFVEVGSYFGQSACYMAQLIFDSQKNIKFDCIDSWVKSLNHNTVSISVFTNVEGQVMSKAELKKMRFDHNLQTKRFGLNNPMDIFKNYITEAGLIELVNPIKQSSFEAYKNYQDQSLDFVYLDGDHRYESVLADIENFKPKIKKGGILAGDDLNHEEVQKAVRKSFKSFKIDEFAPGYSPTWYVHL